jgi:hypothetical protein
MSDKIKLYKCYKSSCNKCIDSENPYFTEDEYNELKTPDNKINCPEGQKECEIKELNPEDYPKPPGLKINSKLIGVIAGCTLIIGVFVFFLVNKTPDENLLTDSTIAKIEIPTEAPVDAPEEEEQVQEQEPSISLETSPSNISLSELFKKIGNSKIPYSDKDALKNQLIENYFKNDEAQVIEIGINNTEVGHTAIKDFLEELSQQNYNFEILEVKPKSKKNINTIKIRRN